MLSQSDADTKAVNKMDEYMVSNSELVERVDDLERQLEEAAIYAGRMVSQMVTAAV